MHSLRPVGNLSLYSFDGMDSFDPFGQAVYVFGAWFAFLEISDHKDDVEELDLILLGTGVFKLRWYDGIWHF